MLECASMRLRVTIPLAMMLMFASVAAWADTIHLKNGRTILVDHVRENGNRYEYEIGDDSYAIPKSSVDRIEAGGMPMHSVSSGAKGSADLPAFTPPDSLANEGDLPKTIVKDGKVDPDALAKLESKGNPELSATADFIAVCVDVFFADVSFRVAARFSASFFRLKSRMILATYACVS